MSLKIDNNLARSLPFIRGMASCVRVPRTVQFDGSLSYTEIDGYKFHTEIYGDPESSAIIVVHGGPGGDYEYLKSLEGLSKDYRVVFYDQRGSGLSPRVDKDHLTLEKNLDDLHAIIQYFSNGGEVRLIGHSWGGMLVVGYLSVHPEGVSQAVVVEPGMLFQQSAEAFVADMKASQSISDIFALIRYIAAYPFVAKEDGHEGFDYVMTRILNRNRPGAPYQCKGESMPPNMFRRGGYEAFNKMLKPVMADPASFTHDLTKGISEYRGDIMLLSSECSLFGYEFQEKYHMPRLPAQTIHVRAGGMGHNMLTLNPEWSLRILGDFFKQRGRG